MRSCAIEVWKGFGQNSPGRRARCKQRGKHETVKDILTASDGTARFRKKDDKYVAIIEYDPDQIADDHVVYIKTDEKTDEWSCCGSYRPGTYYKIIPIEASFHKPADMYNWRKYEINHYDETCDYTYC